MPKVDPFDYLMEAVGNLTGGLITDLKTLFLGMLVCSFILMAFDLLKDAMLSSIGQLGSSPGEIIANYRINRRIEAAVSGEYSAAPASRNDIELSEDRYFALEDAMEQAERQRHRMSDEDAAAMLGKACDDYRRRNA